jgi:hypothetical protein
MGLFDNLEAAPETPEEDIVLQPQGETLETPTVEPETPEEALFVARNVREEIEEEEGMAFGNVNDLGLQFNNTVVKAAGAPVEMMEWALNRVAGTLFPDKYSYSRDHLIDGEWKPAFHNTVGSTKSIRTVTDALGQTSDETPDTYMGYTGATLGEGAAFLMGGAGIVQKTKTAGGVVGAISRNADDALRTKLGTVVAGETVAAGGAGIGRAYAEDNEYGETGSLVVEFTAGAFALLSAGGAKKVVLDPLTAKLKNMTPKEALEKLSKEEIAEVVAEGQRVIAKEEPAPKKTPEPEEAPEASATTATPKETPEPTPAPDLPETRVTGEDGKPLIVYRGLRNEEGLSEGLGGRPASFTESEDIATIYSSKPNPDPFSLDPAKFTPTSNVNEVYLDIKKPLDFTNSGAEMELGEYLDILGYGEKGGITDDEVVELLRYIQRRGRGKDAAKDNFKFELSELFRPKEGKALDFTKDEFSPFDELIDEIAPESRFDFTAASDEIREGLLIDTFILADAPITKTVGQRLGNDGIIHIDAFGGSGEAPSLLGKKADDLDGLETEFSRYAEEQVRFPFGEEKVHITHRPFSEDQVIPVSKTAKGKATPAPKTPEVTPEADPIDASIAAINDILTGDRTGGKGARVTRKVKSHFRVVAQEFFGDINDLLKTKDVAIAKKILSRIDKYTEFDRAISKKDYAQGSELQANTRQAMDNGTTDYAAGITAAGNKRTEDLIVLKGMLQKLVDEDVAIDPKVAKKVAGDAKKKAEGAPKLSKEEKLDAIADQVAKTFTGERVGVFQQAVDGYFTLRLTQMLNQAKTAFVGVPSATFMSVVRPIINTPYNIVKAAKLKNVSVSRRVQYAAADITGTYEYVRMITKHLGDTLRSSKDTILNKGDSNFLYRDRNAYIKDQLAEASEPNHRVKRRIKQAQRRQAVTEAQSELARKYLKAKATILNSKPAQIPAFFFDYGISLIGGLEEISLIAHSMRAARAKGIKNAIDEGADNVWKSSEEYMEAAFDRSRGGLQAKYDPEYADIFNTARRDHFRAMDLAPKDIRKDMVDGIISALVKTSGNMDEAGLLARTLFVFIGVPMRALSANLSYIAAPLNVTKNMAGGVARRAESRMGSVATFGKYNKKISNLELDIKEQKALLKSQDDDVVKTAEKKLAELENSLADVKDLKMQKDYEDLGKLGVGAGLFFLGYEMAKNGQVAGTDSWMTEDQKRAVSKVQGAPNSWKIVMGGSEYDFKYFEPLKGVFALGADYARRQAAADAGALTEDQTMTQFLTSVTKSIATDSPFATGVRYMTQIMSPNPETQERGTMGIVRSLIPVPAEVRNFNKFDEEFVTDTSAGEFFDTTLSASLGQETGNYRLTLLGEPKIKEEPSLASYLIPFAGKTVPEREAIDDILLEDAMSFKSVSDVPTSISGLKLKNFTNEDNEDLYSVYGQLISETRLGGKTLRQALNKLVKTRDFKREYKKGYEQNEQGTDVNEGIEMIKEVISEYRAEARDKILNSKAATDYVDSDDNNIYDILKEREAFSERPESLLESLNLQ